MHKGLPVETQAIVVGGGVVGCSTLYHLASLGVDSVLLERDQLTSGTTWHSAAQVRQLRSSRNLTQLAQYSAALYARLETETGQATGWIQSGSISIATHRDRLTHIERQAALARAFDLRAECVDQATLARMWPLMRTDDVIGAVYSPDDGRVNPSDLCQALSKGARASGGRIFQHTKVVDFLKRADGRVIGVRTPSGDVRADHVIVCGGLWSRDLGAKAHVDLPLLACEHFYLLTKPIDAIDGHLPTLSDHDGHLYIRDDVGGLLVGCFEPNARALHPERLGEDFAFGLLPEDWDHFEPMMVNALHRIPALETAEVRTLLNGPESFTPDGMFLLGPTENPGLYVCAGMNSVGVATGGGAGWALAEWVANGAPPFDLSDANPMRFPPVMNRIENLLQRAPEVLGRHYEISYPGRQWQSARGLRRTPAHDRWVNAGAVFGQVYGWERAQYFNRSDEKGHGAPALTFDRPAWFESVANEVDAAHNHAAVFDQSTFGKLRVTGAGASAFLDRVLANDLRRAPGRVIYTAMLNERGGFESDLTAMRISEDDYLLYVGTQSIKRDRVWLERWRESSTVTIDDVTEAIAVSALVGPKALAVVSRLCDGESLDAITRLPFYHHVRAVVADVEVRVARVSYVGEYGWELSCATADADSLVAALLSAGARAAGAMAQTSMRIEKGFRALGHDLDSDTTPLEADLLFAVDFNRDFVGKSALEARIQAGAKTKALSLVLTDGDANPIGDEPIYAKSGAVGQCTSAAFGYRIGAPVVLGYVNASAPTDEYWVDIAGTLVEGRVVDVAFDPSGRRMREIPTLALRDR
ncbi:MAG: FAD-dependent oxidoreductase [Pseudomonadota bacterium]